MRDDVAPGATAFGVHEINADGIVVEAVVLNEVVVGEHEMDGVAAALADIAAEGVAMRVPGDHVARVDDFIVLDQHVVAVPQAQAVTTHAEFTVLGTDAVVADDAVVRLLEVDAEQAVVDFQVFDGVAMAADIEAGIVGVVRIAGSRQAQVADRRVVGIEHHHRALVAGIDDHLATAVDGQRLVDHHRAGVGAGRGLEHGAGFGLVDQILEGFQAMHALVAFMQHVGRLWPVDVGTDAHAGGYLGFRFALRKYREQGGSQGQPGNPGQGWQ